MLAYAPGIVSLSSGKADLAFSVQLIARQCDAQLLEGASPLTKGKSMGLALLAGPADDISNANSIPLSARRYSLSAVSA
ncbi:hypothetical protein SBBP2_1130002 [Burkholderiales bacterium]|nr:hypothetical protein SBBP2_1130002 [Burkholderiales bacterium]